ncbi:LLM class flavin-dependent oxidoreductase [Kineococcus sp. GCM10028916]|uniref:LLM class flavin-dependent oxidoreductase n=1 Tax=Kineococcus sp. GCM10028916 TaxID=3273394 RepID=UPI0036324C55
MNRSAKRIGFLSFGHYQPVAGSAARTARDALVQTVELAVAAEELGFDGAYVRVHHFARQQAAPFPVLAAMAARTSRIELGTGVIDMRYENPLYMAEEAAMTDLISDGRLQLGVSRGSPEPALHGPATFGHVPAEGETEGDMARRHLDVFRHAIAGGKVAEANPRMTGSSRALPILPQAPGLSDRIWWGSGSRETARWTAEQGLNLMSSTLLTEDTGIPFDELQAEQIALYRQVWKDSGHQREPRVSVSRSVMPIVNDLDEAYFGRDRHSTDQVGSLGEPGLARFGRTYAGDPDQVAEDLAKDVAVQEADTLLVTIPNALGVDYNAHLMSSIVEHVAPALGWTRAS